MKVSFRQARQKTKCLCCSCSVACDTNAPDEAVWQGVKKKLTGSFKPPKNTVLIVKKVRKIEIWKRWRWRYTHEAFKYCNGQPAVRHAVWPPYLLQLLPRHNCTHLSCVPIKMFEISSKTRLAWTADVRGVKSGSLQVWWHANQLTLIPIRWRKRRWHAAWRSRPVRRKGAKVRFYLKRSKLRAWTQRTNYRSKLEVLLRKMLLILPEKNCWFLLFSLIFLRKAGLQCSASVSTAEKVNDKQIRQEWERVHPCVVFWYSLER